MKNVVAIVLLSVLSAFTAEADEVHPHPIVYPNLNPPFDQVVDLTIAGIRDVIPLAEKYGYSRSIVRGELPIVLTSKAKREYESAFSDDTEFVVGLAELRHSESVYGVSFFINPDAYIQQIISVSEDVDRIVFFYNQTRSDAPDLSNIATVQDIDISSVSASNTEDAFKAFAGENSNASSKTAFVFVRGFIEINTNALLDFVLRESWESGAITVGNKASYVKAGMTIGLLPDFKSYGQQLARLMVIAEEEKFRSPRVAYLETDVNAINVRTSLRSDIFANEKLKRLFKYSYPVK